MAYTTTAICGYGGSVAFASGSGWEVTEWTADYTIDTHDVSFLQGNGGDHSRRYISCLKGMTGEFTSLVSGTGIDTPNPTSLHDDTAYNYTATLILKTKASGGTTYTGKAAVNSLGLNVDAKGFGVYKYDFTFTGAVTIS